MQKKDSATGFFKNLKRFFSFFKGVFSGYFKNLQERKELES